MVLFDGLTNLDILLQKGIRYTHHDRNYEENLNSGLIPSGLQLKKSPAFEPVMEDFNLKWDQLLYDAEKFFVKLLLHEFQEVIAKIELDIASELANLNIDDTVQKQREMYTKHKSYENVLQRWRTNKWRKLKDQEKQKIMLVFDETLSSKNTRILIHQESLSRVENSSSRDNIMCEKPLCSDNITSDKTYSTIQVDA